MPKKKLNDDLELEIDSGGVMTMKELREFIKEQKLSPSDLFTEYDILEDNLMKKAVKEQTNFELAYRDELARRELQKMDKENKDESNDFDLDIPGQEPSSGPQQKKKPEKQTPLEGDEKDLFPPGESEPSESDSENQENEDPLLPS